MQLRCPVSLVALACISACSPSQPAASPGSPGDDWENFDPAHESAEQPFQSFNPMRGPALSINGLRFSGESGSVDAMISVYEEGSDVVVLLLPSQQTASQWLEACPRSPESPDRPQLQIVLNGVGDLSHNVLEVGDTRWSTSLDFGQYASLSSLRFQICGAAYNLEDAYHERFQQHAKLFMDRAIAGSSTD